MNKSLDTLERMRNAADLAEHKEVLARRYAEEGLSRLELKIRKQSLVEQREEAQRNGLPDAELYELEMETVEQLLVESEPPQPTPAEYADEIAKTNPLAAEALRHQLKVDNARKAVEDARNAIDQAKQNNWDFSGEGMRRLEATLTSAEQKYATVAAEAPPAFARENEARESLSEAHALRAASTDLLKSPEPHLVAKGQELEEQAAQLTNHATELRGFVPGHAQEAMA
ncbi:MAG: hypothetical protein AAF756_15155 [Pseudomonadota bacterium]